MLGFNWLYAQHLDLRPLLHTTRTFNTVQPSEVPEPREFIQDKSIVLTIGIAFEGDPEQLRRYVHDIHAAGAVGIGFGTGLGFDTVPQPLIDAATELGLGLFEVPRHIPFASILNVVHDELSRRQRIEQERQLDVQEQLNKAAIKGGLRELLATTANYLGAAIAIADNDGRAGIHINHHTLSAVEAARAHAGSGRSFAGREGETYQLAHIMSKQGDRHHLMAVVSSENFSAHARSIIKHCAGLADILLQRPANLRRTRAELNTLAIALLLGMDTPEESIESVFATAVDAEGRVRPVVVHASKQHLKKVTATVDRKLGDNGRNLFALDLSPETLLLLFRGSRSVEDIISHFGDTAAKARIALGVPLAWRDVNMEKIKELEVAAKTLTLGSHTSTDSSLGWLQNPHVRRSLDARAEETYGLLLRYDAQNNTELAPTLAAYLHSNNLIAATSTLMGVHRHTIRTRLARIAEICEVDLSNPVVCAELLLVVITRA